MAGNSPLTEDMKAYPNFNDRLSILNSETVSTLFKRVGGEPFFVSLVDRFYDLVESDPVLRPIYPTNLEPGKAHLAAFLAEYWGGPPRYSMLRGHPRLRMRHTHFPIGQLERDAWIGHMTAVVQFTDGSTGDATELISYFNGTATFLMNQT